MLPLLFPASRRPIIDGVLHGLHNAPIVVSGKIVLHQQKKYTNNLIRIVKELLLLQTMPHCEPAALNLALWLHAACLLLLP
jgi:hypothetical protein